MTYEQLARDYAEACQANLAKDDKIARLQDVLIERGREVYRLRTALREADIELYEKVGPERLDPHAMVARQEALRATEQRTACEHDWVLPTLPEKGISTVCRKCGALQEPSDNQ